MAGSLTGLYLNNQSFWSSITLHGSQIVGVSYTEDEMVCMLHSFDNNRERKYSLKLLPSNTKI